MRVSTTEELEYSLFLTLRFVPCFNFLNQFGQLSHKLHESDENLWVFFFLRNSLHQKKHSLPGHLPLHRLERLEKLLPNIISVQTQMWSYHLGRYILELLIKILLQCLLLHRINVGKCCAVVHSAFNICYAQSNIMVGNY